MAIRYLRRPPKPLSGKGGARTVKRAAPPLEVTADEQAAMAHSLAYFCVACGREHASAEVREEDVCCAKAQIQAVVRRAQPVQP